MSTSTLDRRTPAAGRGPSTGIRARTGTRPGPETGTTTTGTTTGTTATGTTTTARTASARTASARTASARTASARTAATTRTAENATASEAAGGTAPFVLLVMVLLAAGLVTTLWLSTAAAADSYRLDDARQSARELSEQTERLHRDVAARESAPALAAAAGRLGMVPAGEPAVLIVAPDGSSRVVGTPTPASAASSPPASSTPPRRAVPAGPPAAPGTAPAAAPAAPAAPAPPAAPGAPQAGPPTVPQTGPPPSSTGGEAPGGDDRVAQDPVGGDAPADSGPDVVPGTGR